MPKDLPPAQRKEGTFESDTQSSAEACKGEQGIPGGGALWAVVSGGVAARREQGSPGARPGAPGPPEGVRRKEELTLCLMVASSSHGQWEKHRSVGQNNTVTTTLSPPRLQPPRLLRLLPGSALATRVLLLCSVPQEGCHALQPDHPLSSLPTDPVLLPELKPRPRATARTAVPGRQARG